MKAEHLDASMDIKLGSAVLCRDGHGGHVTKLVVKPDGKEVTYLVVQYELLDHQAVVPIKHLTQAGHEKLVLDLDVEELAALPRYSEIDYVGPDRTSLAGAIHRESETDPLVGMVSYTGAVASLAATGSGVLIKEHVHLGIAAEEFPIGRDTRVTCHDGYVGHLDDLLLDPVSHSIRALVLRKGHLLHKDVLIPAQLVSWIAAEEIGLDADRTLLEKLPEYRPADINDQITVEIEAQLAICERTRSESIAVWTQEGAVRLSGLVSSEAVKQAAMEVVGAVPGVLQVMNGLLTGPDVARAVAEALTHDAQTAQMVVEATTSDGGLTLRGWVRTAAEKAEAVAVARAVPGVTAVIDELEVHGETFHMFGRAPEEASTVALASALGTPRRG